MSSHGPTKVFLFPESERFDGTVFYGFKRKLLLAAKTHGVLPILLGQLKCPHLPEPSITSPVPRSSSASTAKPGPVGEAETIASLSARLEELSISPASSRSTSWHSPNPSYDEWVERNAWTLGLIVHNCTNADDLGINTDGTAAECWTSLTTLYDLGDDLTRIDADRALRSTTFDESANFIEHIKDLRAKKSAAVDLGCVISDADFRGIILASLPESYDSHIINMSETATSNSVISKLTSWWIHRHGAKFGIGSGRTLPSSSTSQPSPSTVLQTQILQAIARLSKEDRSALKCTNCSKKGHLAKDCFRDGGGRENDRPSWWRDGKGGGNGGSKSTSTTVAAITTPAVSPTITNHHILSAYSSSYASDSMPSTAEDRSEERGIKAGSSSVVVSDDFVSVNAALNKSFVLYHGVNTYKDSGATDHCFVNRTDFTDYVETPLKEGSAAKKGTKFRILGIGSVTRVVRIRGRERQITFSNVLHTPELSANLISISKLDDEGWTTTFGSGRSSTVDETGEVILEGKKVDRMYMVEMGESVAMSARSHEKPSTYATWHRRFGHAGISTIKNCPSRNLVDGLTFSDEAAPEGLCEDCILGKHKRRPFDEVVTRETELLERVHVDLFGPARVMSRGGKRYMMGVTDGYSKHPTPYFLGNKKATTTLDAFKEYHMMAERQTGKKLKRVRIDNGGEFDNDLWKDYAKTHGILLEFITPYSSAQNGVAEREFGTILDGTRATLIDSGLSKEFWCEAAATHAYIRSLLPTSRNPVSGLGLNLYAIRVK